MVESAPDKENMFSDANKGEIKKVYHFESKLANGAFGQVYLASHRTTSQQFAIKVIQKKRVKDYKTFINEINILRKLEHPNIIKLHEIWEWSECCFLVLEYCQGGELFHFITERKFLSEKEAALIMKQLLSALHYLHQNKISHRDIKPENFMLEVKGDPSKIKMIDFGLSKDFSQNEIMVTMSGSPYYIAPEVFLQKYDSKIDIWSLGVVLYIMLSGKVPFPGNSELEIIGNVIKGDFHFNHEPFQNHSKSAKEFLQRLIVKDSDHRATAEEALNHPWIVNNAELCGEISPATINDMKEAIDMAKVRKAVLSYLTQNYQNRINFAQLQQELFACDPQNSGLIDTEQFGSIAEKHGMLLDKVILNMLQEELDTKKTGRMPYLEFLNAMFLTQLYIKEAGLYRAMKKYESTADNKGVTIGVLNEILISSEEFNFPQDALQSVFKQMLGQDIGDIDPECIIDTEQFIKSLRSEFKGMVTRTLSK